jgi:hypothetical protein
MTHKPKELTRNEGWHKVCIKGSTHGVTVNPDVCFADLRAELDSIEREYGDTHSEFRIDKEVESGWYGDHDSVYYYVYGWRLETEKEFEARCAVQERYDTQIADRERAEFDRLSKKFGSKENK